MQPHAFATRLQSLAARSGIRLRGVVVCNNAEHPCPAPSAEMRFLRGSNELLDFSGYFEGLAHLLAHSPSVASGNVLFVNDTLVTKHAAGCILGRTLALDALLQQLHLPAMAGKADHYRSICLCNPWSGHATFITTFCFLLNARAIPAMGNLKADAVADGVFATTSLADPEWGQSMPAPFREHIRAHLVYGDSPYLWPSATTSTEEPLHKKACCVYFEGRLSGAIGSSGAMLPINSGPRSSADIVLSELASRALRLLTGALR
jgi:hypothetical protein